MRLRSGKQKQVEKNLQNNENENFHPILKKPQVQAAIVHNQHKFDTLYSDLAQPGAYTQTIKLYLPQR